MVNVRYLYGESIKHYDINKLRQIYYKINCRFSIVNPVFISNAL